MKECATSVVFRVDASRTIGTGHVMRCLTLAAALREHGASVLFICREYEGHLCDLVEKQGFPVSRLRTSEAATRREGASLHLSSSAFPAEEDARETRAVIELAVANPDWLIVDHYCIDQQWERVLRASVGRIMAIDDRADRFHHCDLLLDQNIDNPRHHRYSRLLPAGARQLLGAKYALVRPEFLEHREAALDRRKGQVRRVLVSMGGADPENDTAKVLAGLRMCGEDNLMIDVVIGRGNPREADLRSFCENLPNAELHIQTPHMAELMTHADLAINGGGSTTWERCVLGLPAMVAIQSDDQQATAEAIHYLGGHHMLGWSRDLAAKDYSRAVCTLTAEILIRMSRVSASLCDGRGADRVTTQLLSWDANERTRNIN